MEDRKFRPCGQKFRPLAGSSGQAGKRLSHFWDSSLERSRNFSPEVPPEISGGPEISASWPEVPALEVFGGILAKSFWVFLSGGVPEVLGGNSPRRFPAHRKFRTQAEISGPALFQRPDFLEGYLYPSPYLGTASSCNSLSSLKAKAQIEEISQSL